MSRPSHIDLPVAFAVTPLPMQDSFVAALWQDADVVLGAAQTTQTCRAAQQAQQLTGVAAVAVGRLLTGAALLRFCTPRTGSMSLQTLTKGPLHQVFADVTAEGHLRGYSKGTGGAVLPLQRAQIAADVGPGLLSVLRVPEGQEFTRSTIAITAGELDTDLAMYATQSEQVRTLLVCNVLLGQGGEVQAAGGLVAQELPGARAGAMDALVKRLDPVAWLTQNLSPVDVLAAWESQARVLSTQPLRWQCRCSQARAEAAMATLSREDVQAMIEQNEVAHIDCEFCGRVYQVPQAVLVALLTQLPDDTVH